MVATGNSHFYAEPRLPGRVPRVTRADGRRPGKDSIASEASQLQDLLRVPIPMIPGAELPRPKRMPMLVAPPGSIGSVFVMNPQVIQIQTHGARRAKVVRRIEPPKGG